MLVTIDVTSQIELRQAIFQVSNDFATDGLVADHYVINIVGPPGAVITLTHRLPMIRGDGIHTITINGNGVTIDAANAGRVFFIHSGKVEISSLVIAIAQGNDDGREGWDTGFGNHVELLAGGAVVASRHAIVSLSDVTVKFAAASRDDDSRGRPNRSSDAPHDSAVADDYAINIVNPIGDVMPIRPSLRSDNPNNRSAKETGPCQQ